MEVRQSVFIPLLCLALGGIFIADTVTHLEIAFPMLYLPVLFVLSKFTGSRGITAAAGLCLGLTLISYLISDKGNASSGLFNLLLCGLAIMLTGILAAAAERERRRSLKTYKHLMLMMRLRNLSGFSSSLSHELSQPLCALKASLSAAGRWLARDKPGLERARLALNRAETAASGIAATVDRMRNIARGQAELKSFDLNKLIHECRLLLAYALNENKIRLKLRLNPSLPLAYGDAGQIAQVIVNLMTNAIEAAGSGGTVSMMSGSANDQIMLKVQDSGAGISTDMQDQLFNPFVSGKSHGLGLGLNLCALIMKANHGSIECKAHGDLGGAAFSLKLPAHHDRIRNNREN